MAHKMAVAGDNSQPYISKPVDDNGYAEYTAEENATWKILYERQIQIIQDRACDEFLQGLDALAINANSIPQIPDINRKLRSLTGWQIEPVPALIGFGEFFNLLAHRKFPAATFIRRPEDLDYLQEPDIFHEIFGHCPLLTHQAYADFSQHYGKIGLQASKADRVMLARLYWFTIEFGLIQSPQGLRIYGGGILSSKEETLYSLESKIPVREPLDVIEAYRTPYKIDELQKSYFIIQNLSDLQAMMKLDLIALIEKARQLGMKPSRHS